jgi:hypothetical protein
MRGFFYTVWRWSEPQTVYSLNYFAHQILDRMDIKSRKDLFIQEFLKIKSDRVLQKFENLMERELNGSGPVDPAEIEMRIRQSEADFEAGRVKTVEELRSRYGQ